MKKIFIMLSIPVFLFACKDASNKNVASQDAADLIITNGKAALPGNDNNFAQAVDSKDGKIIKLGTIEEILKFKGDRTQVVDVKCKTVIPGLNDSHSHNRRGGRFYNSEFRWDGVKTLKRALEMLKEQA